MSVPVFAYLYSDFIDVPTAVNLLRTWMIMITVMMRAPMCAIPVAPWKIMVFAREMFREKHSAGMP